MYFRVLETGECQAGDTLERIADGEQNWSAARVFTALIQGKASREELEELVALEPLSPQMKAKAIKKLES